MTKTPLPKVGDKVAGTYFGVPFAGTVTIARLHTINPAIFITHVDLDTPVTVFDSERAAICIDVATDTLTDPENGLALEVVA